MKFFIAEDLKHFNFFFKKSLFQKFQVIIYNDFNLRRYLFVILTPKTWPSKKLIFLGK